MSTRQLLINYARTMLLMAKLTKRNDYLNKARESLNHLKNRGKTMNDHTIKDFNKNFTTNSQFSDNLGWKSLLNLEDTVKLEMKEYKVMVKREYRTGTVEKIYKVVSPNEEEAKIEAHYLFTKEYPATEYSAIPVNTAVYVISNS